MIDFMDERYDRLCDLGYSDEKMARLSSRSADEILFGGVPPQYWDRWDDDDAIEIPAPRRTTPLANGVETPARTKPSAGDETVSPQPGQPTGNGTTSPPEHHAPPLQDDAAESHFADDIHEQPIADPAAARIVRDAVKAMRYGTGDKLQAISAASRRLDLITQGDAIDCLSAVAINDIGLKDDAVQHALAHGQKLREQDREDGRLGKDRRGKDGETDGSYVGYWHGEVAVAESRPWCVRGTIPEIGCGLISGQWGTYKTFFVMDLAAAAMTNTPILGSEIDRSGGSLFYAAEGEGEVPIRFQAAIEHRCAALQLPPIDVRRAPFAWITPEKLSLNLLDPESVERFIKQAQFASAEMQSRFGVPLVLMFVDTIIAVAGYRKSGDENDPVINARIMRNGLGLIGRRTRTFAFGVDHFGKDAEVATRGSSAKEDNSDVVLANLGTKDITGIIKSPRVAVRKVRGGIQGRVYPFSTRVVPVGNETTLAIDWAKTEEGGQAQASQNNRGDGWGKGDGMKTLKRVLLNADPAKATTLHPWPDSPRQSVKAFARDYIKDEFIKVYPGSGDTPDERKENARSAFNTAVKQANTRGLIGFLTTNDAEWIWLGGKPSSPAEEGDAA